MQTFYTHENLEVNAAVLDSKRLNKQLLEGRQILDVLSKPEIMENGKKRPWSRHPAVLMWKGYEGYLYKYLRYIAIEARNRNIKVDKNMYAIYDIMERFNIHYNTPPWMQNDVLRNRVIVTHRGNLFNKYKEYYEAFADEYEVYRNMVCCDRCNYYWPTHVVNLQK